MTELLTPKQVARAIGVSESSLKRWCDKGLIPTQSTPGGHRKLPISGVLAFLRQGRHALVYPDAIGLPVGTGKRQRTLPVARQALQDALVSGDELGCREIVLNLFLEGHKLSLLCDELLAEVFREIGLLWECGDIEIYRERRACRMCVRVLHELRSLVPPPAASGPLAMGGTPHGDFYELPTTMVELVLRANGWQATSLGSSLPATTLAAAIADYRPRIFWLSVSHIENEEQFLADYAELYAVAAGKTSLVVGGFALTESIRKRMQYAAFCDNLQHLEAFLESLPATTTRLNKGV